jgi:hypothetical protein
MGQAIGHDPSASIFLGLDNGIGVQIDMEFILLTGFGNDFNFAELFPVLFLDFDFFDQARSCSHSGPDARNRLVSSERGFGITRVRDNGHPSCGEQQHRQYARKYTSSASMMSHGKPPRHG